MLTVPALLVEFEMILLPFFWFMLPFMVLCPVLPPRSRDV